MKQGDFLTDVMRALGFLSRIPVNDIFFENHDSTMTRTAGVFPVAGVMITLPSALLIFLLGQYGADPLLSATIAVGASIALTGALHEDGLADTADGFGGGRSKERALEIMKDSRIGTYGAVALCFSFLIRAAALAVLIRELSPVAAACCMVAVACLSRGAMVWHWQALPGAREAGVAASAGQPGEAERNRALIIAAVMSLLLTLPALPVLPVVIALAAPLLATYIFNRLCLRRIEGHTGDTIGATQQITEIVMFVALALIA
ncbi:adenosylcobinamide-GDP ribazoletransferase [Agrobacterium larrymoorei]|uniref:adenosylcobinamide-GDP ribazoletransferase n=1 Tax=Agrobacterium larrymoorei TaxID=160699 RepID=UPI001574E5D8|nr:adenosylcobinamide-GDP ribazoletransferase [Agrobacterium larrymoorei]NTJ42615.1 adenosylcobinamide-GDP ribazoletransferase [Agrobacterium larrymoorei]